MNRSVSNQFNAELVNRGVDIRFPSSASLLIDSEDRIHSNPNINVDGSDIYASSSNFTINPGKSILNGYFTRFALTEVELNWNFPNVTSNNYLNEFSVILQSPIGAFHTVDVVIPIGFYTVEEALTAIKIILNLDDFVLANTLSFSIESTTTLPSGDLYDFPIAGTDSLVLTSATDWTFVVQVPVNVVTDIVNNRNQICLASMLGFSIYKADASPYYPYAVAAQAINPCLLPTKYIDIVSAQIAGQQSVKDGSTNNSTPIENIYRWVFAWDSEPLYDGRDYPILQGYRPFKARRYLSFPKQIKWDPSLPFGQVGFQIYQSSQINNPNSPYLLATGGSCEFQLLILASEI